MIFSVDNFTGTTFGDKKLAILGKIDHTGATVHPYARLPRTTLTITSPKCSDFSVGKEVTHTHLYREQILVQTEYNLHRFSFTAVWIAAILKFWIKLAQI